MNIKSFLVIVFLIGNCQLLQAEWVTQTVDSAGNVGGYASIAIDTNNYPHISYFDSTNQDLKYAKWTGTSWSTQTIDSLGNVGSYTSIALDTNNYPHISYYAGNLRYAKWNGSSWSIQTVDSVVGGAGYYTSIALDTTNYPHISYYDYTNDKIKYAKWNSSSWSIRTHYSAGNVGGYTSIALDTNNNSHISYCDCDSGDVNGGLIYMKCTDGFWSMQTVNLTANVNGGWTSIALDTNNNPHISYRGTYDHLDYAKWNGSSWSIQTIDYNIGDLGGYTSIALDTNNYPHISYFDSTNYDLKYAKWNGTSWSISTVDSAGQVGWYTSIALDTNNNPHISYYDGTNGDLKYAINNTNPSLSCTGEINYTTDGLNPETGLPSTTFTFRVKYTDADNDIPASGYPKVHIKKGGSEITNSPFTMNYTSGTYSTGAIYSFSTILSSTGTNYTYYFEAYDVWSATASGSPTDSITKPSVTNAPTLSWTGEPDYVSDGLDPEVGNSTTAFTFRVKYTDIDNDPPANWIVVYFPKISQSYYVKEYVYGNYNTGAIYSLTITSSIAQYLLPPCSYYTYQFQAYDVYGVSATQFLNGTGPDMRAYIKGYVKYPDNSGMNNASVLLQSTVGSPQSTATDASGYYEFLNVTAGGNYHVTVSSTNYSFSPATYTFTNLSSNQQNQDFTRLNNNPLLSWIGETNYTSDGLNPETGVSTNTFTYRVKYTDVDDDSPKSGSPKLHVKKGGTEISGSPFTMNTLDSTQYSAGRVYSYSTTLSSAGADYTYYFEAYDVYNATATGTPVTAINAPDVQVQPTIFLSLSTLNFSGVAGGSNPSNQTFTITNTGSSGSTLSWTAGDNAAWLSLSSVSGSLSSGNSATITVSINTTGLSVNTYTGTITLTDSNATNNPQTISVTLYVTSTPQATISLSPGSLNFSATVGGNNPSNQTFTIANSGASGSTINWTISDNADWLSLSPASGALSSSDSTTVTASINIVGLSTGSYTGTITVTDSNATNSPQTVSVTLTITPAATPTISLDKTILNYSSVASGNNPSNQTFTITNTGGTGSTLNWTISDNANWLSLSPVSGSLSKGNSTTVTASVDINGLATGNYSGTVTITDSNATNSPQTISVVLAVTTVATPTISLDKATMSFSALVNGSNPSTQTFAVTNTGGTGSTLNWIISDNANWLSLSPMSGALTNGNSTTVTASIDITGLTTGSYTGTVTVTDSNATNSPQTISVSLAVISATTTTPSPTILLDKTTLNFSATVGGSNPSAQTFTITNIGGSGSTLNWAVSDNADWLNLSPVSDSLTNGNSTTVTASVNTTGLTAGNYTGTVTVTDSNATNSPQTVSVTLSISAVSTYYIKGYVKRSSGAGIEGATVQLQSTVNSSQSIVTDSSGYYGFTGLTAGNYTVTPMKTGYTFSPVNKSYTALSSNQTGQNFVSVAIEKTAVEETVKPAQLHFSPSAGARKKIQELKEKIQQGTP